MHHRITKLKNYNILMSIEYNRENTVKAKNTLRKDDKISTIWKRFYAPSNIIGNCTNLYRLHKPISEEDFFNKYIQYALEHKDLPISKRGLSEEELINLANDYMQRGNAVSKKPHQFDTYLNDMICHIITETYDGKIQEINFTKFLESLGYKCDYFEGSIDGKYGLDIKVTKSDGKLSAIQIKPISFFTSTRSDVQADRINLCVKYEKTLSEQKFKTYYAIYKKDSNNNILWVKNKDGFRFRIEELFSYDKENIYQTFSRKPIDLSNLEPLPIY